MQMISVILNMTLSVNKCCLRGLNRMQVLEYQPSDKGGDADDNLHLIFNWETAHVKNVSTADPWQTKMPKGMLDDDRDNTRIWSVPQLKFFPVRFLKHKKSGEKKNCCCARLSLSAGKPLINLQLCPLLNGCIQLRGGVPK
jgi:hypothetical protein